MTNLDDTQPHPVTVQPMDYESDGNSGPGCLVWGVMSVFTAVLGIVVVLLAAFVGWSDGQRVGQMNATASAQEQINQQCDLIPQDLAAGRLGLAQERFRVLGEQTPAPDCVLLYAPTATQAFIDAQPTATPTPTETPEATPTATSEAVIATQEPPTVDTTAGDSDSAFDPAFWLAEAQRLISADDLEGAISALEAVQAIDSNHEKATVDRLLFNSLTTLSTRLFRSGQNLAYAITLADRASAYGDIGDLSYESYIAGLYLEAQSARGVNYLRAIRALRTIVFEQGLTNYLDAYQLLVNEYVAYGDAYVAGLEPCPAIQQYENALSMQASASVTAKRDAAQQDCLASTQQAPTDPNDPNAPTPASVAPVGVQ